MLVCSNCSKRHPDTEPRWCCAACGDYLLLAQTGMFSPPAVRDGPPTLWRYREALGVDEAGVTLGEGFTPLVEVPFSGRKVFFKMDHLCPTGSYKDRGSAVMISKLRQWRITKLIEDSSGNAGASIAAYASLAGIRADIYVPASTSPGKLAQIRMYGAKTVCVPGSREDTAQAAWNAAQSTFYGSHNWSPYFLAGMKTAAYEIAEQLAWTTPDWVITPVGGGGLLVGLYQGFAEMQRAGIIRKTPKFAAVQAANCAPVEAAWRSGASEITAAAKLPTAAEGISVAKPVRGRSILEAVRNSGGVVVTVSEDAIWRTLTDLGNRGIYVEPTSAAAPAALPSLISNETICADQKVVILLTGHGLKATDRIVAQLDSLSQTGLSAPVH